MAEGEGGGGLCGPCYENFNPVRNQPLPRLYKGQKGFTEFDIIHVVIGQSRFDKCLKIGTSNDYASLL